jgi:NitT/TauT family transport system permease protein
MRGSAGGSVRRRIFTPSVIPGPAFNTADALIIVSVIALLAFGIFLAVNAPVQVQGPQINLAPEYLPWYAAFSLMRMVAAYGLSFLFTLVVATAAARNPSAEKIILPILDILQSVPILSFLPVVVLALTALLPQRFALELGAVVLIFTSQVWNLTFSFYQALKTMPSDLGEASSIFRLNPWLRFRTLSLPFGAIPLVWNSMMSWAGGWFFLMAAETFTVGERDYRLAGLGSYLQTAADGANVQAILWGVATLIGMIVLLDQFIWRPLLAWADRFKLEMVESDAPPTSWFYDVWQRARVAQWWVTRIRRPFTEWLDARIAQYLSKRDNNTRTTALPLRRFLQIGLLLVLAAILLWGAFNAVGLMARVTPDDWGDIVRGAGASFLRVLVALVVALAWTVPVGVAIGMNPRLARVLQPIVQVTAAVPATALFPILVLILIRFSGGLDLAAIVLMLMGTQWYVLFNIIAGAAAIPRDLVYTVETLGLRGWARWRTMILPAVFPYLITGMITAAGGSWNATIVAEYVTFGGQTYYATGLGAEIAKATAAGNYPLLLAATLTMIVIVVAFNRFFWRRLYRVAEERFRMD